MKKYLIIGLVILIAIASLLYFVLKVNGSENKIKKEIELANYCETKSDCVQVESKCPFDCFVYVNKNEKERINKLISNYESNCVYGCIQVVPVFDCVNKKCVLVNNDSSEVVADIDNFEKCVEAGNSIMESYPRQCRANGETFTEEIDEEAKKKDLIRLKYPRSNDEISSSLIIEGEARGYWFFEASFPVVLVNWDGLIISQGIATAESDWMTEDFVPFKAVLEFEKPEYKNNGTLILKKDNPSGLPENDDALEIPVIFK